LREAVLHHGGEAAWTRAKFNELPAEERDAVAEFLKSLQVRPPGTPTLVVNERGGRGRGGRSSEFAPSPAGCASSQQVGFALCEDER